MAAIKQARRIRAVQPAFNALPLASNLQHRSFGPKGNSEHFLTVTAPHKPNFKEQLECLEAAYAQKLASLGISPRTAVFRRIFLSDIVNQMETVKDSYLLSESEDFPTAVSVIQQPPWAGSKMALLAYHIQTNGPLLKERLTPNHLLLRKNDLDHLWSTGICTNDTDQYFYPASQTRYAFVNLINTLASMGGDLSHNCIRTWIYLKDIDMFYQGMVNARRDIFLQHDLTSETHYMASSGIQGACEHRDDLFRMDAYSILGLESRQITFLNDLSMLCPPKKYHVTFERATRVAYADRSHYYISSTAGIDATGHVLHDGHVVKQMERILENIEALLESGNASLDDLMYVIVYLRDPADFECVNVQMARKLPEVPAVIVHAPLCRREALIEMEGVAVTANDQPLLPQF